MLLDILDMRGFRDAKKAVNDPNVKAESIPMSWQRTVLDVKNRQYERHRKRLEVLKGRRKPHDAPGPGR